MTIAVLGAGSISTPHLVRYLAQREGLVPTTIVLAGRTARRLAAVARAARILAEGSSVKIESVLAAGGDWRPCLAGADIVLVQVRVGGYDARRYDETFPLDFDLCGDEGLGPGGLAAAWRTWPELARILSDVRAVCPGSEVLLLTSPVSLLVRIARAKFPGVKLAGICELPFTTLREIARRQGSRWEELEWDYLGINHIGWLYGVGTPDRPARETVPLKYLRLEDAQQAILACQKARPGHRARELAALTPLALEAYAAGGRNEIVRALATRPADWYEAAVGPFVAHRVGLAEKIPFFLSVPQAGWHAEFEADDILEIPHVASSELTPRPAVHMAPSDMKNRLLRFVEYERAAARAVAARDRIGIAEALALHPWVPGDAPVAALAARIHTSCAPRYPSPPSHDSGITVSSSARAREGVKL
jgi:6-phospho-beta-glucosidase